MSTITQKGFGVIEVVVGATILTLVLFGLAAASQNALRVARETAKQTQANFLLEEGAEAVRLMRDNSWENISALAPAMPYYLSFTGGKWATTTQENLIDGVFDRTIVVADVSRDANGDIVSSGGTLDPDTVQVTISVSWLTRAGTTTDTVETYLGNIFGS